MWITLKPRDSVVGPGSVLERLHPRKNETSGMKEVAVTDLFLQTGSATGFFAFGLGATLIILKVRLGDEFSSVTNYKCQPALKRSVANGAFGNADLCGGLTHSVKHLVIHE